MKLTVCLVVIGLSLPLNSNTIAQSDPKPANKSATEVSPAYPAAVDPKLVGTYSGVVKSGGGVFYDDVLEYRVWIYGKDGDTFKAFATFEEAQKFSKRSMRAEAPLVLVRQKEHVNEPSKGVFEHKKENRIAEWQPSWLATSKRLPDSIEKYIASGGTLKNGVPTPKPVQKP
jgi:hypothetical protein